MIGNIMQIMVSTFLFPDFLIAEEYKVRSRTIALEIKMLQL